jgi:hypothetical protein
MLRPAFHLLAAVLSIALSAAMAGAQTVEQARVSPIARQVASPFPTAAASRVAVDGTGTGVGWTLAGASAGAVVGGIAGALVGAALASRADVCQSGDPDGCLGATIPEALWGIGVGITVGTPIGAHLGNRRAGNLAYTSLTSAAIFAAQLATLFSLVEDGRTEHENTVIGVAIGAPVLQIIATTLVERAFSQKTP